MTLGRRAIKRFKDGMTADAIADSIIGRANEDLKELDKEIEKIANGAVEGIKQGIKQQAFNFAPLSREHAAWKARHGKDSRILIMDNDYIGAITVIKEGPLKYRVTTKVGLHKTSQLPYAMLSRYHEHGTSDGIPKRPHFGPARQFASHTMIMVLQEFYNKQRKRSRKKQEPRQ